MAEVSLNYGAASPQLVRSHSMTRLNDPLLGAVVQKSNNRWNPCTACFEKVKSCFTNLGNCVSRSLSCVKRVCIATNDFFNSTPGSFVMIAAGGAGIASSVYFGTDFGLYGSLSFTGYSVQKLCNLRHPNGLKILQIESSQPDATIQNEMREKIEKMENDEVPVPKKSDPCNCMKSTAIKTLDIFTGSIIYIQERYPYPANFSTVLVYAFSPPHAYIMAATTLGMLVHNRFETLKKLLFKNEQNTQENTQENKIVNENEMSYNIQTCLKVIDTLTLVSGISTVIFMSFHCSNIEEDTRLQMIKELTGYVALRPVGYYVLNLIHKIINRLNSSKKCLTSSTQVFFKLLKFYLENSSFPVGVSFLLYGMGHTEIAMGLLGIADGSSVVLSKNQKIVFVGKVFNDSPVILKIKVLANCCLTKFAFNWAGTTITVGYITLCKTKIVEDEEGPIVLSSALAAYYTRKLAKFLVIKNHPNLTTLAKGYISMTNRYLSPMFWLPVYFNFGGRMYEGDTEFVETPSLAILGLGLGYSQSISLDGEFHRALPSFGNDRISKIHAFI